MKKFMMAALPWICIGFAIALFAANQGAVKKAKDSGKEYGNYMTEGMCLGMCVGTALGGNGMIYGMQIDAYTERMTDTQLGIFCLAGPVATLLFGWVLILLAKRICTSKSKLFKAVMWYSNLSVLIIDPLDMSVLCGFFGGGDMNGIKLLFPEIVVRIVSAVIGVIHGVVIWKYLLPSYTKSFQKDNIHGE